jgi:S1-C subfamily serine protease
MAAPFFSRIPSVVENVASCHDRTIADYARTIVWPVTITAIGASVRDGRAKLIDGQEVSGVQVIDVAPAGPAALAGIQPAKVAAKAVLAPIAPLLLAIDHGSMFERSDVIFAADAERIRSTLDFVDRVQGLAPGELIYLTLARRGLRVQIRVTVLP